MINKNNARIATLNARSFLSGHQHINKTRLSKFLRSTDQKIDILCLQDISASYSSNTLTEDQSFKLQSIFQNANMISTKYVATIILNSKYATASECVTIDGRGIITSIVDSVTAEPICQITNIYAPPDFPKKLAISLLYFNLITLTLVT